MKKIAIIGPESTGKSDLARSLAAHFHTQWVPEFARTYLDNLDRAYQEIDLLSIAKGQLDWEDKYAGLAKEYLMCDTNLIVIKIWSDHKFGHTDPWILDSLATRHYDFYLLTDIDIPWQPDPQREHPHMRQYFFDLYQDYLIQHKHPFAVVHGMGEERLKQAIKLIEENFG